MKLSKNKMKLNIINKVRDPIVELDKESFSFC